MANKTIKSGFGYWDVTHYPYGGCFKRTQSDVEVEVIGPAGKYPKRESKVKFSDGSIGVVENRSFSDYEDV